MVKKFALAGAAALAFSAAPAFAAPVITGFAPVFGVQTAAFGNLDPKTGSATHTDTLTFATGSGELFGTIGTFGLKLTLTNLDFVSASLNGTLFDITKSAFGIAEGGTVSTAAISPGLNTLIIKYKNAQAFASYGGTISYLPTVTAPVPEPATWGMMILGFGMLGASMRYRRRETKVSFA